MLFNEQQNSDKSFNNLFENFVIQGMSETM